MTFQRWARSLIGAITADDTVASPVKAAGGGEAYVQDLCSTEQEPAAAATAAASLASKIQSGRSVRAQIKCLITARSFCPGEGGGGEIAISSATCDISNNRAKPVRLIPPALPRVRRGYRRQTSARHPRGVAK